MAIRFRKSLKIAPGIRLSASHRGLGVRVGGRGGGISFSPSGTRVSASLPGTGLSWSEKVGSRSGRRSGTQRHSASAGQVAAPASRTINLAVTINVDDDSGEVTLLDADTGQELEPGLLRQVKKQQGDVLRERLGRMADQINETREGLISLHGGIPSPTAKEFIPLSFEEPKPQNPSYSNKTVWQRIWPLAGKRYELEKERIMARYQTDLESWELAKQDHQEQQRRRQQLMEEAQRGDSASMETLLGEHLENLDWPHETLIAWEFVSPHQLLIDIDFPEVEMLPARKAALAARGLKLNIRKLSVRDLDELYARHIASIGVKLAGECFHLMPTLDYITLSGYSQRLDKATGHEQDDYLYSVRINREGWSRLNFERPEDIDAYECLGGFEIRRNVANNWKMKPIEPFKA